MRRRSWPLKAASILVRGILTLNWVTYHKHSSVLLFILKGSRLSAITRKAKCNLNLMASHRGIVNHEQPAMISKPRCPRLLRRGKPNPINTPPLRSSTPPLPRNETLPVQPFGNVQSTMEILMDSQPYNSYTPL